MSSYCAGRSRISVVLCTRPPLCHPQEPTKVSHGPLGGAGRALKAGSNDKTLKLYEGHFHDLLADVGKQQVMADIQAWIDAHIGTEIPRGRRELRT